MRLHTLVPYHPPPKDVLTCNHATFIPHHLTIPYPPHIAQMNIAQPIHPTTAPHPHPRPHPHPHPRSCPHGHPHGTRAGPANLYHVSRCGHPPLWNAVAHPYPHATATGTANLYHMGPHVFFRHTMNTNVFWIAFI